MISQSRDLSALVQLRGSKDFDTRCSALSEIITLAFEAKDPDTKTAATDYLHTHMGIAVVTDPPKENRGKLYCIVDNTRRA